MFNLMGLTGIMETEANICRQPVALIQLSEEQALGIGGDPAPGKISNDFFVKKTFKDELVMADCFPMTSLLRS
jgi:hypothetical protein